MNKINNELFTWFFSYKGLRNIIKMLRLNNIHQGKRCFIIGNGPSLNKMDLSLLRNEYTFGLNRIYLLFPKLGFTTTYFVSINNLVIEQCADEITALPIAKFISWNNRKYISNENDVTFVYRRKGLDFSKNIILGLWGGSTVTYTTMQIAYYMGFNEIILIGVDHNFVTKGTPHKTVTSDGNDPNHFSGEYFGLGFRWQLPDLEHSEKAYRIAKEAYDKEGRKILDATIGGKLNVFPKVNFNTLF